MEIISYLDNRQTSYNTNFKPMKTRRVHSHAQDFAATGIDFYPRKQAAAQAIAAAGEQAAHTIRTIAWYATRRFKLILLIAATATAGFFLTYGLATLVEYQGSVSRPLTLAYLSPNELEVLDKAMEQFALVLSDEIDASGNIMDGETISIADVNLSEPVTFTTYTVRSGDTISGISRKFGLTNISTLIAVNDIGNVRQLREGQKLTVPSIDGLSYIVQRNDTIEGLSARYNVVMEDILDVNDLSSSSLVEGQKLFIPGARLDTTTLRKAMGELFMYPLSGNWRLTSRFGKRADPFTGVPSSHTGIDMAIGQGTPIKAAMSGKIIAVGYTNVYGNYVILDHENGYQTLYAHMQKPSPLKKGQRVSQGAQIGLVGNTGYSTGPHLHFTVYKNGKLIDPLTVLK